MTDRTETAADTAAAPDLTEELITTAMAKAEARVCVGSDRCYAFPDRLRGCPRDLHAEGPLQGWVDRQSGRARELRRLARGEHGTGQAHLAGEGVICLPVLIIAPI